jgi:hypothetical protein
MEKIKVQVINISSRMVERSSECFRKRENKNEVQVEGVSY